MPRLTLRTESVFEPLPEHDEMYVGPYGVEAPPNWDFVVTTEVTVAVRIESEKERGHKLGQGGDQRDGSPGEECGEAKRG
jgi:hypothetical protein